MRTRFARTAFALLVLGTAASCTAAPAPLPPPAAIGLPSAAPRPVEPPSRLPPSPAPPREPPGCDGGVRPAASVYAHVVGWSVEGRDIRAHVRGRGDTTVLLLGGIHGNEPASTALAQSFLAALAPDANLLRDRRVVVLPAVNPDGLAADRRRNAHGVDLNRNFAAANREDGGAYGTAALSEPEARAVLEAVRRFAPARILSLHQPLACVDWDGPAEPLARAVAAACDLPLRKLGTRPGSFGAFAEESGVPLVTLELPAGVEALSPDELRRRFAPGLEAFVRGGE